MSFEQYRKQIEAELNKIEPLNQLEKKIHIPKIYIVLGTAVVALGLLLVNVAASLVANLVGFVYPAYASFKALESPGDEDDKLWLTYWVVYSSFSVLEFFSDWLLFWLPFYFLLKLIFLVYLFVPRYKGAVVIYDNIIRPILKRHEAQIDQKINEYSEKGKKAASDLANNAR